MGRCQVTSSLLKWQEKDMNYTSIAIGSLNRWPPGDAQDFTESHSKTNLLHINLKIK